MGSLESKKRLLPPVPAKRPPGRRSYYELLTTAAAEEIRAYAAIATVSSELDGIFTLNEQHGKAFSAFFSGKQCCFALPLTGFGKSSMKTCRCIAASHGAVMRG